MGFLIGNNNVGQIYLGSSKLKSISIGEETIYGPPATISPEPYQPYEYFYFKAYSDVAEISISEILETHIEYGSTTPPSIDKTQFPNYVTPTFEYSYDKETWTSYVLDTIITLNKQTNPRVYFRGNNIEPWYDEYETIYSETHDGSTDDYTHVHTAEVRAKTISGFVKSGGNLLSLRDASLSDITTIPCNYAFPAFFQLCKQLLTAPVLSATTLKPNCYGLYKYRTNQVIMTIIEGLFEHCSALVTAPELPATTLTEGCYEYMFADCISLITAPELPATTLAERCYAHMFRNCQSLIATPELPATTLAPYCYTGMFAQCRQLTSATDLPATILVEGCYGDTGMFTANTYSGGMFAYCTSLRQPPIIYATTLAPYCYTGMFAGSGITETPPLKYDTLATYCFGGYLMAGMFEWCQNLTKISTLPALSIETEAYSRMFAWSNVKASATQTAECQYEYRIPETGTGTANSKSLDNMFTDATDSTVLFTPSINTTFYISVPSF